MTAGKVVAVLAALAALAALALAAPRQPDERDGPPGSSYVTEPHGAAAYAQLLEESDRAVTRVRRSLERIRLRADDTVVVLEPSSLTRSDAAAIGRFVAAGGRAVLGGRAGSLQLDEILDVPPRWSAVPAGAARPLAPVPESAGIAEVRPTGTGAWTDPGQAVPFLGEVDRALAAVAGVGEGRVVLLADPSVLYNGNLAAADNAALGLAIAGPPGTRMVFLESAHGFPPPGGLANLPVRWRWAVAGLVAAGLVWMLSRARRLGPPAPRDRGLPPPRVAYVEGLGAALARTRRPAEAIAPVRSEARRLLASRTGLAAGAPRGDYAAAATALGLGSAEVEALLDEPRGDAGIVAAGRALAHLAGGPGAPPEDGEFT